MDFIIIDFQHINSSTLNVVLYYIVGAILLVFFYFVFSAKSKLAFEEEMAYKFSGKPAKGKNKKAKKPGFIFKLRYKIAKIMEPFSYYLLMPISFISLAIESSEYAKKRYYMRFGWLSHLEYSLFKQSPVLIDGYSRVKELSDFKNFPMLFCKETTLEDAMGSDEYLSTVALFKSYSSMKDIFSITEGYMTNDSQKYDQYLDEKSFNEILNKVFHGNLDDFRVYDGKDRVYFSFPLMKKLIDEEAKKFMIFVKRFSMVPSQLEYSRTYKPFFDMLKKDKATLKMLKNLHCPDPIDSEEPLEGSELTSRVNFVFEIYFRFCASFYIINQYINLPAGTVVVRMDDYSLRMIVEAYDNENIVSIEPRKNDGSTDSFKGDPLVNMFLLSWNYYNYSVTNSLKTRVYNIFNLRDEAVENRNAKSIDSSVSDMSKAASSSLVENETTEPPVNFLVE